MIGLLTPWRPVESSTMTCTVPVSSGVHMMVLMPSSVSRKLSRMISVPGEPSKSSRMEPLNLGSAGLR